MKTDPVSRGNAGGRRVKPRSLRLALVIPARVWAPWGMSILFSCEALVALLKPAHVKGSLSRSITGIASLDQARPGDLSFLGNAKYKPAVSTTEASVVLLPVDYDGQPKPDQVFLHLPNPSAGLALICGEIERSLWPRPAPGIHPSAVIDPSASIDPSATIGPHCVIEAGASVGARSYLQAQVFLGAQARVGVDGWLAPGVVIGAYCTLADRVRFHPGVVIGADGFGYEFNAGRHEKVPQIGIVAIGDDVEMGANSCIDRARFAQTSVGQGTKIDNLVQIGHNVVIGKHCMICAHVGIAGSTTLGDYVVLGGQAGVGGHLNLGTGTKAGGGAGIGADTAPGAFVNGTPAIPYMLERRLAVLRERTPELFRRVDRLEAEWAELKKTSASSQ